MDKQRFFRRKLVTAVMAVFAMTGSALAQESEPANDQMSTAQLLTIGADGSASVSGVVGTIGGTAVVDVDFYSFDAFEKNLVTINIDGGATGLRGFDSIIYIFGPGIMNYAEFDDYLAGDEGSPAASGGGLDARVDGFEIPQTGRYTVAVTTVGVTMNPDGTYEIGTTPSGGNGDYTLKISGVVVAPAPGGDGGDGGSAGGGGDGGTGGGDVVQASIEIKAGELVRGSRRDIVVALLSSPTFDPRNVDVNSLTFALGNGQVGLKRCSKHGWRINRDNRRDLVCHFSTDAAGVPAGNVEAVLRGKMKDNGPAFEGKSTVKVIDRHADRRGRHDRDRHDERDHRRGRDRD